MVNKASSAVAFNFQLNHEFSPFVYISNWTKKKLEPFLFLHLHSTRAAANTSNFHIPFGWMEHKLN